MRSELRPGDLVAVREPPGERWLRLLADLWADGVAVLPVDHRLSDAATDALLSRARPTHIVRDGEPVAMGRGVPTDAGVGAVVATSGTRGTPLLVEVSRESLLVAVQASAAAVDAREGDAWLCVLPVAHMGGLLVLLRGVLLGAPVTIHPRFDPAAFAAERDAAFTSMVPSMLVRLLKAGVDLARFRAILVGGAAVARTGAVGTGMGNVIETYGLTESCGGVVYDGRPLAGTEIRIGEEDEIQLRGPTVMRGYRLNSAATAAAFTDDGWLRTGDAGALGEGGLHVRGRMDDLILTGGEKVWPEEVEGVLRAHAGVADAAVAGSPDPEWGERVVAFVIPASPSAPPRLEELRAVVRERLAPFKAPREVRLVPALPRTRSGKVRRDLLPSVDAAAAPEPWPAI